MGTQCASASRHVRRLLVGSMVTWGLSCVFVATLAFAGSADSSNSGDGEVSQKTIEVVLREQTDQLMSLPGVVGIARGQCAGQPCIKVYIRTPDADLLKQLPSTIDGYEVVVQETGEFRARDPD